MVNTMQLILFSSIVAVDDDYLSALQMRLGMDSSALMRFTILVPRQAAATPEIPDAGASGRHP
jgi:hypothetical protein